MKDEDALKDLFVDMSTLPEYDLELERRIMDKIDLEEDHSVVIRKYRRWSRIGFIASICLMFILLGISFSTIADTSNLDPDHMKLEHYIPSLFALIGLVLIFVQMEFRKQITLSSSNSGQ